MEPIARRKTTKEIVYDQLKRSILSGELDPNQMMTETSLAESLHISRTPVREAVGDLTKKDCSSTFQGKALKSEESTRTIWSKFST